MVNYFRTHLIIWIFDKQLWKIGNVNDREWKYVVLLQQIYRILLSRRMSNNTIPTKCTIINIALSLTPNIVLHSNWMKMCLPNAKNYPNPYRERSTHIFRHKFQLESDNDNENQQQNLSSTISRTRYTLLDIL